MRQVMRHGEDLVLPVKLTSSYTEGRFSVGVYAHKMIFAPYRFVTNRNPYGLVEALNGRVIRLSSRNPYPKGQYRVRYWKKGKSYSSKIKIRRC